MKLLTGSENEKGQALVLFALSLGVLAGLVALTIDVGFIFRERRQLQNAADAAALAGVAFLPGDPVAAEAAARDWAGQNGLAAVEVDAVEFENGNTLIRVKTKRGVSALFARALGLLNFQVKAKAAARVGSLNGNRQAMPWGLLQGDSDCLNAQGNAIFGQSCLVKAGAQGAIQGWRGALDYDGPGDAEPQEYLNDIIYGQTQTVYCPRGFADPVCQSSTVDTQTGNIVGQTRQGLEDRLAREPVCDSNSNGKDDFGEVFKSNAGANPPYTVACPNSPRLMILPIVSYSSEPVQVVTIEGWALAYLESYACTDGSCQGQGHLAIRITIVNAAYPQSPGSMGPYNLSSGIVLRKLVE